MRSTLAAFKNLTVNMDRRCVNTEESETIVLKRRRVSVLGLVQTLNMTYYGIAGGTWVWTAS